VGRLAQCLAEPRLCSVVAPQRAGGTAHLKVRGNFCKSSSEDK
jgi:2-phospho-L-lactate guanylyltransferase (CobY/MobA/RfbA family)